MTLLNVSFEGALIHCELLQQPGSLVELIVTCDAHEFSVFMIVQRVEGNHFGATLFVVSATSGAAWVDMVRDVVRR